jgi:hypothetical protein
MRRQFAGYGAREARRPRVMRMAVATRRWYQDRAGKRWFRRLIALVFTLRALSAVVTFLYLLLILPLAATGDMDAQQGIKDLGGPNSWIAVGASLIAGGFTIAGLIAYRRSRLRAYRRFEVAVLVNLLLAQPFNLLDAGFAGAVDILIDLLLLVSLGYMQAQERAGMDQPAAEPELPAAAPTP